MQRLLKTLAIAAGLALAATIPASAAPTAVTFKLVGTHPVDQDYHQGTFTAPAPMCPSGTWLGNGQGPASSPAPTARAPSPPASKASSST